MIVFCTEVCRESFLFLPLYASVLLAHTIGMWIVYETFGFHSLTGYYCYWISLLLNAGARSLAIAELCRYKLRVYQGIWGLVWRLLGGVSMLFLLHAAIDTWGQPNRLAIYSLTLDRDLDIASVAILAALLLVHNYYGLSLEPFQRTIAAGICLVCAVDVIGDTILRSLFTGYLFPDTLSQQSATLVQLTASIRARRRDMEHDPPHSASWLRWESGATRFESRFRRASRRRRCSLPRSTGNCRRRSICV